MLDKTAYQITPALNGKFMDPFVTTKGETRASVGLLKLETLWINTGTICNLTCRNCYIESSPTNDRLVYISDAEVREYLNEIMKGELGTKEIAFTGGEPFINTEFIAIMTSCLEAGFDVLVLTNAMRPMMKVADKLLDLQTRFADQLTLRVSTDHYTADLHEEERGENTWTPMLKGLKWLSDHGFNIAVAGRTCWNEEEVSMRAGYKELFSRENIRINADNPQSLVLFPEMSEIADVPEITTACWDILNVSPKAMMCSSQRMIVKRKGADKPTVVPCTLLPYDEQFDLGEELLTAEKTVQLNHPHCAKFCVLGGGSCTG